MDLEKAVELIESSPDYRIIRKLAPVEQYFADDTSQKRIGIYLDVETTGMDAEEDTIIEIALVPFEFNKAGQIFKILPAYNAFQDPGIPIPDIIPESPA